MELAQSNHYRAVSSNFSFCWFHRDGFGRAKLIACPPQYVQWHAQLDVSFTTGSPWRDEAGRGACWHTVIFSPSLSYFLRCVFLILATTKMHNMTWSTPHLWQSLQFLKACWNSSGHTEVSAGAHAATVALVLGDTKEAHRLAQQVLDSCEPFTISFLKRSYSPCASAGTGFSLNGTYVHPCACV